jgi:hypothetical protein
MGDSTRDATLRGCEKIGTGTFATAGSPGFSPFRLGASPIFSQPLRTGLDVAPCCSVPPGLKNQRASGDPKHPTRSFLSIKVALHECGQRGRESFSANDQPYGKPLHRKRLPTPSPDSTKKYLAGCLPELDAAVLRAPQTQPSRSPPDRLTSHLRAAVRVVGKRRRPRCRTSKRGIAQYVSIGAVS